MTDDKEHGKLSHRQHTFIQNLIETGQVVEAAKRTGINPSTGYGWMKQDSVRAFLGELRVQLYEEALTKITAQITRAIDTLGDCLHDDQPNIRIRAALGILDHCYRMRELYDFEQRLTAIEDRLDGAQVGSGEPRAVTYTADFATS